LEGGKKRASFFPLQHSLSLPFICLLLFALQKARFPATPRFSFSSSLRIGKLTKSREKLAESIGRQTSEIHHVGARAALGRKNEAQIDSRSHFKSSPYHKGKSDKNEREFS
jgi:hypothetical protein